MDISEEDATKLKRSALSEIQREKEISILEIKDVSSNATVGIKRTADAVFTQHTAKMDQHINAAVNTAEAAIQLKTDSCLENINPHTEASIKGIILLTWFYIHCSSIATLRSI